MNKVVPYLTFDGTCEEAMNFYKGCFGGEVQFVRARGSPLEEQLPPDKKDQIIHSSLVNGDFEIFGMDNISNGKLESGNALSLSFECEDETDLRKLVDKLSKGGKVIMPVDKPFWGGFYSMFDDRYGIRWMLMSQD